MKYEIKSVKCKIYIRKITFVITDVNFVKFAKIESLIIYSIFRNTENKKVKSEIMDQLLSMKYEIKSVKCNYLFKKNPQKYSSISFYHF